MTIQFIGITPDKNCITKDTLDEILATPHIDYIFKVIKNEDSEGKRWPDYVAINRDGSNRILSGSNFTVIDISDISSNSFYGRNVKVFDKLINQTYVFKTHQWGYDFITKELLSLIEKIEEYGSCERYRDKLKYDDLEKDNADLKKRILILQEEIELLKSKKKGSKPNKK